MVLEGIGVFWLTSKDKVSYATETAVDFPQYREYYGRCLLIKNISVTLRQFLIQAFRLF